MMGRTHAEDKYWLNVLLKPHLRRKFQSLCISLLSIFDLDSLDLSLTSCFKEQISSFPSSEKLFFLSIADTKSETETGLRIVLGLNDTVRGRSALELSHRHNGVRKTLKPIDSHVHHPAQEHTCKQVVFRGRH